MDNIDKLVSQIYPDDIDIDFNGPQTEQSIETVEVALGYRLPPSYRQFVLEYGGSTIISGIYGNQPLAEHVGNVVFDTLRTRADGLADHYIVIYRDLDTEQVVCLNALESDCNGEYPVFMYDIYSNKYQLIADHFMNYIEETLQSIIDSQ